MEAVCPPDPGLSKALRYLDRKVSAAVRRFGLIQDRDRILVAVSGGKDSRSLLELLAARRRWVPEHYELVACHVRTPGCTTCEEEAALRARCAQIHVPLEVRCHALPPGPNPAIEEATSPEVCDEPDAGPGPAIRQRAGRRKRRSRCFACAWQRRRLLFEAAAAVGCPKVAMGHHLDDLVETSLLNLFFRGELSTMYPRQSMFGGEIIIIRPLALVEEKELARVARLAGARPGPGPCSACEAAREGQRSRMKALVRELRRTCPGLKANILRSVLKEWDPKSGGHAARSIKEHVHHGRSK